MNISGKQAREILAVSHWLLTEYAERWGVRVNYTPGGHRRYELASVLAVAERWAKEREGEAAVIRGRADVKV